jgi:Peptidase inhibitor I78 family
MQQEHHRMTSRYLPLAIATLSLLPLLAACQAESPRPAADAGTPAQQARCDRDAAAALAGKPRISDDKARALTGARVVRQIAPGDAVTKDYSEARVTIETDPASGQIVSATCG